MKAKFILTIKLLLCLVSSFASAGTLADTSTPLSNTLLAFDIGVIQFTSPPMVNRFSLGYSTFNYSPAAASAPAVYGGFLGKKVTLSEPYELELGVFAHGAKWNLPGVLSQGIEPPYMQYNYTYTLRNTQLIFEAKLLRQFNAIIYGYLSGGIGAAWNKALNYTTTVPAWLTVTPSYQSNTQSAFSYSLSAGGDFQLFPQVKLALGYYFSDLGSVSFGPGVIRTLTFNSGFKQNHLYANTFLARLSYTFK